VPNRPRPDRRTIWRGGEGAVTVVFDHSLHSTDLALDTAEAVEEGVLGGGVAAGLSNGRGGHRGRLSGVENKQERTPKGYGTVVDEHTLAPYLA
jgi:hypothetical protein